MFFHDIPIYKKISQLYLLLDIHFSQSCTVGLFTIVEIKFMDIPHTFSETTMNNFSSLLFVLFMSGLIYHFFNYTITFQKTFSSNLASISLVISIFV